MELTIGKQKLLTELAKGVGVLIILALLMMWLSGAFRHKVEPGPPLPYSGSPAAGSIRKVEYRSFPLYVEQVGTLRTRSDARISGRIMAQVVEIPVKEGDMVTGPERDGATPTILARLDDRDIQARIRQAESQVKAMEKALESANANVRSARAMAEAARAAARSSDADFGRTRELLRNQAATGQQLDHARSRKESADARVQAALGAVEAAQGELQRTLAQKSQSEAALAEARVMLSHTLVRAPFSGRVARKLVQVGDMVSPGQPIFAVETPLQPEFHAVVSESLLKDLEVGRELTVHIDALDRDMEGVVREITPQADPSTRTVTAKVSLPPQPDLTAGLFGRLRIPTGEYATLVIPVKAVREVGQLQMVDVMDSEGRPRRRFVTLGHRHEDMVEVLSGLNEGEEVTVP